MSLQYVERTATEVRVHTAKCRRCNGDRLWVDFQRELQCLDCDPPGKTYRTKFEAQRLKVLAQAAQMQKLEDEEAEDKEREKWEEAK